MAPSIVIRMEKFQAKSTDVNIGNILCTVELCVAILCAIIFHNHVHNHNLSQLINLLMINKVSSVSKRKES